jgi:predicted nucleotidyltransferase
VTAAYGRSPRSVARGDDRPDSDIDILVDLDPAIVVTIFDYAGVKDFIADMFDRPVDVVSRESLKPVSGPRQRPTRSMLSETERDSLSDILFNIDLANSFARGFDYERFLADMRTTSPGARCPPPAGTTTRM